MHLLPLVAQTRTDFERARRCRKLQRLLNSLQLRRSIELLRSRMRYLLFAVVAAFIAGFIALHFQHDDFHQEVIRIRVRRAIDGTQSCFYGFLCALYPALTERTTGTLRRLAHLTASAHRRLSGS